MNIRTYYLLKCHNNANIVIASGKSSCISGAIGEFKNLFPNLKLDQYGYYKIEDVTYCVASKAGE
jgi:hypothetical protein